MSDRPKPSSIPSSRIVISGWYGHNNTGDEAILQVFLSELVGRDGAAVTVLSDNAARVNAHYGSHAVAAVPHPRLTGAEGLRNLITGQSASHLARLRACDLFVLGGGSILHDRMTRRNLVKGVDEIWLSRLCGRPVALFAVGVGPLSTRIGRWLVSRSARRANLITVRDEDSKTLLVRLGVPEHRVIVVADPTLLLEATPVPVDQMPWVAGCTDRERHPCIGLFLMDNLPMRAAEKDQFSRSVAAALDRLHDSLAARFVAVPMMRDPGDDDRRMAASIQSRMTHARFFHALDDVLAPGAVKWLAGRFDLTIAVRLHGLLFSFASATPATAIEYHPKVRQAARSFGVEEYVVAIEDGLTDSLVSTVLKCHTARQSYRDQLRAVLPSKIESARRAFTEIRALIERHRRSHS